MSFVIAGLEPAPFAHLFGLSDQALAERQAVRMIADAKPGFPCRVTLEDAEPGEAVLLVNHEHLPVETPYRSAHAIFVREGAGEPARFAGVIPEQLSSRLLSVRAFDGAGMMTDADVIEGTDLEALIARFFADATVAYLHVHNARRGCFAARVDRAS
ncbi:DUF1203 domain-containing protein [Sphingomonas sp.]|jgi:hypothetical protein|uniref:DUF1203 domain-containing protein n=1 Tax=Sphingomonas sp. TaxID=28214 RepID=UPI002ED79823